jgi:serine phosphatase RsbU (regulator of sigma subunit)
MLDEDDQPVARTLNRSHASTPNDVPRLIVRHGAAIGARDVAIYLTCYDQRLLVPVPHPGRAVREAVNIEGTLAGRSFRLVNIEVADADDGGRRVWVPILDGTERLGVLEIVYEAGAPRFERDDVVAMADVAAELILTKTLYGDLFQQVRRRQPMSLSAELIWRLLPPLTFADEQVVITAVIAPPYDVGGDAFDYAVDDRTAHVAIFDAVGHGLRAGTLVTVAIAAYRLSRRSGLDLVATCQAINDAIAAEFGDAQFVTGIVGELDLASGRLAWCSAGHPQPLLLRGGRVVKDLTSAGGAPWGLSWSPWVLNVEQLEPGDKVVLLTDGMIEARDADGRFFGMDRFTDFLERMALDGTSPPEQIRRLLHAVLEHQVGELRDDATALLVEWHGDGLEGLTISPE